MPERATTTLHAFGAWVIYNAGGWALTTTIASTRAECLRRYALTHGSCGTEPQPWQYDAKRWRRDRELQGLRCVHVLVSPFVGEVPRG